MDMTKLEGKLPSGSLDFTVFECILSLDGSDDNDSGQNLVFGFLGKAEETFDSIEESLICFLSLTTIKVLGLIKVTDGLLTVERYSLGQNEDRTEAPDSDDLDLRLERVTKAYDIVKNDYGDVEGPLREFYEELGDQKGN
ncbi:hypothetical protein F9C07_2213295 [Aspergillus flavus]|uniref:Uncharacterized protein n=1 Tax=Aspergillus flavus (strain ATCC 200026 / FGSC A1120 / IAM 13836 / NRRL 3357 / JCM 12722 / SRRC 167) TaxID=332952 RepID=A0A7U2QZN1_ASPFN|nr:hypothetical protein F9C07_2213295 [Aspergillus flavus]